MAEYPHFQKPNKYKRTELSNPLLLIADQRRKGVSMQTELRKILYHQPRRNSNYEQEL